MCSFYVAVLLFFIKFVVEIFYLKFNITMKKIITIALLVVTLLVGGMTVDAKTTKKKAKTKSHSTVIGKFEYTTDIYGSKATISLLSNGNIKCTNKCIGGSYEKITGAYKIFLFPNGVDCGHWCEICLIVGDYAYAIGGGFYEKAIVDCTFNPKDKTVRVMGSDGVSDRELMEFHELPSLTLPLSYFEKVGKVTWIKKKP